MVDYVSSGEMSPQAQNFLLSETQPIVAIPVNFAPPSEVAETPTVVAKAFVIVPIAHQGEERVLPLSRKCGPRSDNKLCLVILLMKCRSQ